MGEIKLYEHQEIVNGMFLNKFLCVHDDTFGREFKTKEEIVKYIDCKYAEVNVISKSESGINAFELIVKSQERIDSVEDLFEINFNFSNLDDVRYYEVIPFNFNFVKEE